MINLGQKSAHESDYVVESKNLVKIAAEGKTEGIVLAEMFFEMDKKYPKRGWAQAGRLIFNRWAKKKGVSQI